MKDSCHASFTIVYKNLKNMENGVILMTSTITPEAKLHKKDKLYYINSAIGVALMFLFSFLPPFGPVTPLGMKFLGIFIGLLYLWSTVDMGWPIFAAFVSLIVLDCMPITQIYTSAFANPTMMLCLFTMLAIMPLADTGIFDYVAVWLLKKPFLKGHPWRLTISLFSLAFIGCICQGGIPILFMVFELTYKICDMCGMKRSHPWAGAIITGAVVSFVIGGGVLPFTGLPLFIVSIFSAIAPFQWPFLQYILFMIVMEVAILFFYCLFIKLLRVNMKDLQNVDVAGFVKNLPPPSAYQKKAAALLGIFILTLVAVGIISSLSFDNALVGLCKRVGLVGVSWIFMCGMVIWRVQSKPAFTFNTMAAKVPWDSVLIICIGMSFGPAIASEATGISALLYQITAPLLAGHSTFVFILLVCISTLVLTNFLNNTVVIMLMISVIAAYIPTLDINIITLAAMMLVASQMAMFVPGASYYAGLAHGQATHVGRKNGFLWGGMIALSTACAMPIMLLVGNMLF